jgi:hypothetical protein
MAAQLANQNYSKQLNSKGFEEFDTGYHNILMDLMCHAYAQGENFSVYIPSENMINPYILHQFFYHAIRNKSNFSTATNPTKYIAPHKPNHRSSVDDFVNNVRFSKVGNRILLHVNPDSERFKDYNIDFLAINPRLQEKVLNTTH